MDRRGFLGSILAACAAPAIVRADSLMRIVPRGTVVLPFVDSRADLADVIWDMAAYTWSQRPIVHAWVEDALYVPSE